MPTFRKPYDGKRVRSVVPNYGESRTQQQFKDACDINKIIARVKKGGLIDHVNTYQGNYADLTDVPSYQDAMNKIIQANDCFMTLPSDLRKKFDNNPQEFLAFVADPSNHDAMVELGLISAPAEAPAPPVVEQEIPAVAEGGSE
jgi:phage internal scaffolding protein